MHNLAVGLPHNLDPALDLPRTNHLGSTLILIPGGLIEVDYDKARQIFGEGKTPEQILSGAVRTPSEFAPVRRGTVFG